ncbi:MAG TPA: BON domain-containing protein [Burkholderiales bacterium]|nr:BON domain-containing protein [Burkholderiales bacterium]
MRPAILFSALGFACLFALQGCVPLLIGAGVGAGMLVADDRRSSGTMLEDQTIEIKASNRIKEQFGDQVRVNVTSFNRHVLVAGTVPSEQVKGEVEMVVLEVPNVRNVQNELAIAGGSSLMSRSNDGLLTSRVKSRLVQSKDVSANHIKVTTDGGVVYLMGLVTRAEAEDASQVAATTGGVQRVVKVFEYLD